MSTMCSLNYRGWGVYKGNSGRSQSHGFHLFSWAGSFRFASVRESGGGIRLPDSSARVPSKVLVICCADTLLRTFSASSLGSRALVVFPCSLSGFGDRTMTPCDMNLRVSTSGFFCKRRIDSYSLFS